MTAARLQRFRRTLSTLLFNASTIPFVLRRMARPCAHVRETERVQKFVDIARMKGNGPAAAALLAS